MPPYVTISRKPSALIAETRKAFDAGLFIAALNLVLTIPDVCSALESEDGFTTRTSYCSWCERYLDLPTGSWDENKFGGRKFTSQEEARAFLEEVGRMGAITSADLYQLRCAELHTASSTLGKRSQRSPYDNVAVVITEFGNQLVINYGANWGDDSQERHLQVSLTGLIARMEHGVARFLSERPELDHELGEGTFMYPKIVDFRNEI